MNDNRKDFVLLTGATSDVGQALTRALLGKYNFILGGRNPEVLKELQKKYAYKGGPEPIIWEQDLNEPEDISNSLKEIILSNEITVKKFIHGSGYFKMMPLRVTSLDNYRKHFNVNVLAAAEIIKVLINRKVNEKTLDAVVFISSNVSNHGTKAFSAYGASKAAEDGLMRNLAIELSPDVRVNSVLPGGMETKMTKAILEKTGREGKSKYPLGIGTPENLVGIVELLLSDKASWITGQQFVVDGGRTIDITD